MFGAITSKPVREAQAELVPELQGKGLVYRSPIVRMRQSFDLYTCLRPCKAYPGNPLNYKPGIDLVVFRENTEGLYAGVEFAPVPAKLRDTLAALSKPFAPFVGLPLEDWAVTCKINTKKGSERIIRAAFEYAKLHGYPKVTVIHKANVVRATEGLFLETARRVAADYHGIAWDDANVDAITMWLLKNPGTGPGGDQPVRRHRLGSLRRWSAGSASEPPGTSARSSRCSSRPTARRPSTRDSTKSTRSRRFWLRR
jgi:3-isopropylmalate dehydrogenase